MARAVATGKATQVEDLTKTEAYRSGDPVPVAAADVAGIRTVARRDGSDGESMALLVVPLRAAPHGEADRVCGELRQAAVIAIRMQHL
jgi:hypothetical protein